MVAWIKMRTSLNTDPAVVRIATAQKLDRWSVIGRLHTIWSWAGEHSADGQDMPIDDDFIDELAGNEGFAAAMRRVGWLTGDEGSLCFPRFDRHNGESAKARAIDAERKRLSRKPLDTCPPDDRTNVRKKPDTCPPKNRTDVREISDQRRGEEIRGDKSIDREIKSDEPKNPHDGDERFQDVWARWKRHLMERNKPLTPTTEESQLCSLFGYSSEEATAVVEFSILNGAVNLILNGNHRGPPTGGVSTKRQRRVPSFEEGLLRD